MQEQTLTGAYKEPQKLDDKKFQEVMQRICSGRTKRLLIFAGKDADGKPTKEMRRAWRRFNSK